MANDPVIVTPCISQRLTDLYSANINKNNRNTGSRLTPLCSTKSV